jgi:uncharacterized protein (TIGR03437 family)
LRATVPEGCLTAVRRAWLAAAAIVWCILPAAGQNAMDVRQTRYVVRAGEPVQIVAPPETLDFLKSAKSRQVEIVTGGTAAAGGRLVAGPNRAGDQILLAASLRTKPGEYTVKLSATSAAGEQRQTILTVEVQPLVSVPSGSTRNPVVLLNGWETGFTGTCPIASSSSDTFGNLAQYLVSDGVPVVYLFDNCVEGAGQLIETLGNDLGAFLNTIQYDTGAQVPQIDLVGFSMGGLIARAYLAGLQPNEALTPPTTALVGKLVLIATPNFGSFVAGNYALGFAAGSQDAELEPGSAFLWNLATWNQRGDDLRGVDAIAVIGNAGNYTSTLSSATALTNASDGLVSLTSASLGFVSDDATVTRVVPYCHVDPSAFTNTTLGTFACNAVGIANVTSTTQETGEIVRSFLAGTTDWQSIGDTMATNAYLKIYGAQFFALVNGSGSYATDMTGVTFGTVSLANGGDSGTIFYADFVSGTGTFVATSSSLGSINCGSLAEPLGYTSALRCKLGLVIFEVGPLAETGALAVNAGTALTITGAGFGSQCSGCKVVATPAGSTTGQQLTTTAWASTSITANLPASLTGLVTIQVLGAASAGSDAITVMVNPQSTLAVAPASLQFAATVGGTAAAQSIQITNSASGTLNWTATVATASASWLSVSPASGTAPSTLTVSVSPAALSAGTYTSTISIAAAGASNTPVSVSVTLTVTAATVVPAALTVAPQALAFQYAYGGAVPAAQSVVISNASGGALAWTASSDSYWLGISAASGGAPAMLAVSLNPVNLAAGTYTGNVQITAAGASGSPATVSVTLVVSGTQPAGVITSMANGASFQPGFAAATWISIFGTNLSQSTYQWQNSDIVNGLLPTSLQGVSVTVDGVAAIVEYISPTQINVLAPDDATTGTVQVQVTAAGQTSNSFSTPKNQFAPAFFTIDNGAYVAAQHADYSLVGAANLLPGVTTTPAHPGETILLYGTGFGPTNPPLPTAQSVTTAAPLANSVQITIGGAAVTPIFAGLVSPGLYQFNVTVPNLPNGDAAVLATIGGVTSQTGVSVTVQQ